MQTKEAIKSYWNKTIKEDKTSKKMISQKVSDIIVFNTFKMFKELVLDKVKEKVSVLEVGCGSGVFTDFISKDSHVKKIVPTDISEEGIRICKNKGFRALVADAENLQFKNKSFDIVCGFEVLHHLNNPKKAIDEACRVSKKFVFFHEPNSFNPMRRIMEKFYYKKDAHEKSYSFIQYKKWFKGKSFSLKILPYNFLMPYFSNDTLIKINIMLDRILNKLPTKFIGASIVIVAERIK